jgi:hypothetical protein
MVCEGDASCIQHLQKGDPVLAAGCGWQRRRSHLPQVVHRIVRQDRHAHLLENELLQEIVRFFPSHAVGINGVSFWLREVLPN